MKYYKKNVDDGFQLMSYSFIPTIESTDMIEISKEEYSALQAELEAKWEAEIAALKAEQESIESESIE